MKERQPAIAQQAFERNRDQLSGLPLADRFSAIHDMNLWGAESSRSGVGSERDAVGRLAETLPALCKRLDVMTIIDAPCGDGNWIASLSLGQKNYIGLDIVPALIKDLDTRFSGDPSREYRIADLTKDALPRGDLLLCRDCLVHLSFDNIGRVVTGFKASGSKWLLTTHFPEQECNEDITDGDWRPLNLCKAPFFWPAPAVLINEDCQEAGGSYRDKSLALWALKDLPG